MRLLLGPLANLFFPATCLICKKDLVQREENSLCFYCRGRIHGHLHVVSGHRWGLEKLASLSTYEGFFREIIRAYKYQGKDYLAPLLGTMIPSETRDIFDEVDGIIPVPSPFWREIKRGYNPAHLIGDFLSRRWNTPLYSNFLRRSPFSRPQVGLRTIERSRNAKKSFRLNGRCVSSPLKHVLLVDDVITTGATLKQCGELLKSIGVQTISGLVLAFDELPTIRHPRGGGGPVKVSGFPPSLAGMTAILHLTNPFP